ncbi:hypothetical protein V8C86DRAFT_2842864 [Haematococcus lacustris]
MGGKRPSKTRRQSLQELNASPKAGFKCCPNGLKAQRNKAQVEAMKLRAQVEQLHQQLGDAVADYQLLQADMEQLQADMEQLQADMEQLQADMEQLQADMEQLQADMEQLQADMEQLQADMEQLQADMEQLQADMEQLQAAVCRGWRHAGEAVAEVAECQQRRAPAWARELCKHLQDSDLLLRITVVAVVGQTYLMPELLWASKDDGLHAFEFYRHIQQVCKGLQQPWANNAQLLSQLHSKLQQLVPIDQQEQQKQQLATYLQQHCATMEDYYRQHCKRQLDMPHLMAALGGTSRPWLRVYFLACPTSNAPVESLLQLLKHGVGRFMELPALLEHMSLHTHRSTLNNIDVHDFALQLPKLRAAVRLHEVAAAEARAPATAVRKATAAACSVGVVVVNVGDHASQQRVAAAATTAGYSRVVSAGVPPPRPHPPPQPPPQQPPQQQGPPASPDFGHMYQLALAAIATEGQAAMAQAPAPGCTLRKRTTPAGLGQPQTAAKRKR